jgi:hypothetical protein
MQRPLGRYSSTNQPRVSLHFQGSREHQQNKGKILDGCNHLQALRITKNHHNHHKFIFDWQSAKLITIVSSL